MVTPPVVASKAKRPSNARPPTTACPSIANWMIGPDGISPCASGVVLIRNRADPLNSKPETAMPRSSSESSNSISSTMPGKVISISKSIGTRKSSSSPARKISAAETASPTPVVVAVSSNSPSSLNCPNSSTPVTLITAPRPAGTPSISSGVVLRLSVNVESCPNLKPHTSTLFRSAVRFTRPKIPLSRISRFPVNANL